MLVEVKLYYYHDLDLIGLFKTGMLPFAATAKAALRAYARKESLHLTGGEALHGYKVRRYYRFNLFLVEEEDDEIIQLLQKIKDGYRNNFIKTVLRFYICAQIPEEYVETGEMHYFLERMDTVAGMRKSVKIGKQKRSKKKDHQKKKEYKEKGEKQRNMPVQKQQLQETTRREEPKASSELWPGMKIRDSSESNALTDDLNNITAMLADITGM